MTSMPTPKPRRRSVPVRVGPVTVGGAAPIVVQSMTSTDTADIGRTVSQVAELARAGSEIVRLTVNDKAAAAAIPHIRARLDAMGLRVPLVGDFHFNGHRLLADEPACAERLAGLRINPGNVGQGSKRDLHFAALVEIASRHEKPVRIGVNWGSLDQQLLTRLMDENAQRENPWDTAQVEREAIIVSALESAARAEAIGLPHDRIVISAKVSAVQDLIAIYSELATRCEYPLHLGLTEAGMGSKGIVASTAAMRVACPGCGRTTSTFFQTLAQQIESHVRQRMPQWKQGHDGVEEMTVAVMGFVVNGPGESKCANIGISLPGTGKRAVAPVYEDGEKTVTLKGDRIAEDFQALVERYVERRYVRREDAG